MKKTKEYNNFKDASKLPTLKKNQTVVFEVLGIRKDPKDGTLIIPSGKNVKVIDVIEDPTDPDGEAVVIAYIDGVSETGIPRLGTIWFEKEAGGKIVLTGTNLRHREIYTFLSLHNSNASNKNRDKSVAPRFRLLNIAEDAKTANNLRSKRKEAMDISDTMTIKELKEFAASLNQDENQDEEVLRNLVGTMAENDPDNFLTLNNSNDRKIRADVRYALQAQLIKFDKTTRKFTWTSSADEITTIPRTSATSGNHLDGFVSFVKNHKNGEKLYEELKNLISEKQK